MKEELMDEMIENMTEDELEEVMESIVVQLEMLLERAGVGHLLDGKLTMLPASESDTLH